MLSRLYRRRADLKELCADFSALYEREAASSAADGSAAAELAARLLEQYISQLEEPSAAPREEPADAPLRPEDIKRVKGLGFLQHKGTNKFNGRVITRNGRITADEAQAITDSARHYGDGHLMMTTRLTIEVSGIDYGDIDAFRADLAEAGLETGGTGAKVRPVVSCKGTTCQYGLYDTYALSEEIHQRFYKGYRDVALPHKFKIAVGGCPNNCVKPNLNDLGMQQLRPVHPEVPLPLQRRGHLRLEGLCGRPLGQARGPRTDAPQGIYRQGGAAGRGGEGHPALPFSGPARRALCRHHSAHRL